MNRSAIVEALRFDGPLSRQQIGAITGLSPATVNRLSSSLIEDGLVVREGQVPSTGGRPSVLLRYAGNLQLVAAIQLRANSLTGVLVDFDGVVEHRIESAFPDAEIDATQDGTDDPRLRRLLEMADELVAHASLIRKPCLVVGVSVPGTVRNPEATITNLPELGWDDLALKDLLASRMQMPVVVENDANALAFGEFHRGEGRGFSGLVAIHLDYGMGGGIISNGELHRGHHDEAGEIGYLLVGPESLDRPYPGFGDLEGRLNAASLTAKAQSLGMTLARKITAGDVLALAEQGDPIATKMVPEILDMVALAVGAMSIILDPELVVLGGALSTHASTVIPHVVGRLTDRIIHVPRIIPATFLDDAVVIGLAEIAAQTVRRPAYVAG